MLLNWVLILKIVKLLVKRGADIHKANDDLMMPIRIAVMHGRDEIADYLIEKGTNFDECLEECCRYSRPPAPQNY